MQEGPDWMHHYGLFISSLSLPTKWSFCQKYVFPDLCGIFWRVNAPRSVWAGCSRDNLIDEGKFCKYLYNFEEWDSRICTFLFLPYQILHIFLRWCQETKIFQEQTFIFVVFTKLSCLLQIQYYVFYSVHTSGKHH